ncbi:MAG: hypothetical protein ACFFHD_04980 [Promethearchaeota archaeon]
MLKKLKYLFISIIFILFFTQILFSSNGSESNNLIEDNTKNLKFSANLEGLDNIIITEATRVANISEYGLIRFEDQITFKNLNNNPITSVFIATPLNYSNDLVYYAATGNDKNTLLTERSYIIMEDFELITIYLDSPLLPHKSKTIIFIHQYKNLVSYYLDYASEEGERQFHYFVGFVYPTLPYKSERDLDAFFFVPNIKPDPIGGLEGGWGFEQTELFFVRYKFSYIEDEIKDSIIQPFLKNLYNKRIINVSFYHNDVTKMEITEINREIFISPWGIIKVKEDYTIENLGLIDITSFPFNLPHDAKKIYVSDDFGKILGTKIDKNSEKIRVEINLLENRVKLTPNSSFTFNIEYYLIFEKYYSINWFQESIEIDLLTTNYKYLGKQQTINIIIDGCSSIDSITELPDSIKKSNGRIILTFISNYVTPESSNLIQFTFTQDLFDLLLRPLFFILLISVILSSLVVTFKLRKKESESPTLRKEFIPINEIREFCSLYDEKTALILEIRKAEEETKRKKMAKKNYNNILNKNTSKIDEIEKEVVPFKKILMEESEILENIIKRLDILEAERTSIKDSLNLLESRYKRGKLPSRAAYLKLSDDFKKRRRKIDRTIDKFVQQLRSYLL